MQKILLSALLLVVMLIATQFQAFAAQSCNYQDFKTRYQTEGRTPEGAAHLYFEATFCYMNKNARSEASKMLRYAMHWFTPIEKSHNHATFVERLKDPSWHHTFRSFAEGTSPENNYRMDPANFTLNILSKKKESDFTRLYLRSTGADSPRNIWMQEHDGLWYTINNASTYSQVRAPQNQTDARRNAHDADYD